MTQRFNLVEQLQQIPDYRKGKGRRHSLWLVMMLVLLTLCGYRGYRPLADFSQQHWLTICELLELPQTTRIPSYSHNRQVYRRVEVYSAPTELQQLEAGLKCLIWVTRWGLRQGKAFEEQMGYISDLDLDADTFAAHIQHHWGIENRLHWVRDVTFEEDFARPGGNAPIIWSILNCFMISIIRHLGYRTIPQGVRILTNQVQRIFEILTVGFSPPK